MRSTEEESRSADELARRLDHRTPTRSRSPPRRATDAASGPGRSSLGRRQVVVGLGLVEVRANVPVVPASARVSHVPQFATKIGFPGRVAPTGSSSPVSVFSVSSVLRRLGAFVTVPFVPVPVIVSGVGRPPPRRRSRRAQCRRRDERASTTTAQSGASGPILTNAAWLPIAYPPANAPKRRRPPVHSFLATDERGAVVVERSASVVVPTRTSWPRRRGRRPLPSKRRAAQPLVKAASAQASRDAPARDARPRRPRRWNDELVAGTASRSPTAPSDEGLGSRSRYARALGRQRLLRRRRRLLHGGHALPRLRRRRLGRPGPAVDDGLAHEAPSRQAFSPATPRRPRSGASGAEPVHSLLARAGRRAGRPAGTSARKRRCWSGPRTTTARARRSSGSPAARRDRRSRGSKACRKTASLPLDIVPVPASMLDGAEGPERAGDRVRARDGAHLPARRRTNVIDHTGEHLLPAIEFDDGTWYREDSRKIAAGSAPPGSTSTRRRAQGGRPVGSEPIPLLGMGRLLKLAWTSRSKA